MHQFLMDILGNLLAETLFAVSVSVFAWWWVRRRYFGTPLARYRQSLHSQLTAMPFIYADLQGEVLNDFVEIDIQVLSRTGGVSTVPLRDRDKLRRSRRIIFLGDAGIGKTTYQRFAILSILRSRGKSEFAYSGESTIPVYVPLKLVDTSEPSPVLRFLLNSHQLFSRPNGLHRLYKYALSRRLFLFLDGYDEVSADVAMFHLERELNTLFGTDRNWSRDTEAVSRNRYLLPGLRTWIRRQTVVEQLTEDDIQRLLRALRSCRIWLSSRREFFAYHGVAVDTSTATATQAVAIFELKGIGANRRRLVKNIFDKYRRRESMYELLLSEEYFVSELDRSPDPDLRALSFNPLFLTVMCYLYVNAVSKHKRHDVDWQKTGLQDLIFECIRLLIRDLDEAKARDLPPAHREGLLRRRNEYPEEKEAFLMYFAAELLFDGINAFTLPTLRGFVRSFFDTEEWPTKAEILNQLEAKISGRPDFALQLVYSGLFITVAPVSDALYYDFPHRRFREVLALRYVTTPSRYCRALLQADRVHFEEFLRLLRNSQLAQQRDFQEAALRHILHVAAHDGQADRDVKTSHNFIKLAPAKFDAAPIMKEWLMKVVGERQPRFVLSETLLRVCKHDDELARVVLCALEEAAARNEPVRFALAMNAIERAWPTLAEGVLMRDWRRLVRLPNIRATAAESVLRLDLNILPHWIQEVTQDIESRHEFLYSCARVASRHHTGSDVFARVWPLLAAEHQAELVGFIARFAPNSFASLPGLVGRRIEPEWVNVAVSIDQRQLESMRHREQYLYVSTATARETAAAAILSCGVHYIRAKVKDKVFDKETLRWQEFNKEIDVPVLPEIVAVLQSIRNLLDKTAGAIIEEWPSTEASASEAINQAVQRLTPQRENRLISGNRKMIKADQAAAWALLQISAAITVPADIVVGLRPAAVAWEYKSADIPAFFV
jgi:hypothetical protein